MEKKPLEIKKLQGTVRPCRETGNRMELAKVALPPHVPDGYDLNDEEMQIYQDVCTTMIGVGLLTMADLDAIVTYTKARHAMKKAWQAVDLEGVTVDIPTAAGTTKRKHPAFMVIADCFQITKDFRSKFGMTPSDRERLSMGSGKEQEKGEFDY